MMCVPVSILQFSKTTFFNGAEKMRKTNFEFGDFSSRCL